MIVRLCRICLDWNRTNSLLSLNRMAIHYTIASVTGHCPFDGHAEKLGIPSYDYCRSCTCKKACFFLLSLTNFLNMKDAFLAILNSGLFSLGNAFVKVISVVLL